MAARGQRVTRYISSVKQWLVLITQWIVSVTQWLRGIIPERGEPSLEKEALLAEFREVWSHYRHLEAERNRYTGYFWTVTIALIGFGVNIYRDTAAVNRKMPTLQMIGLAAVYSWMSMVLYLSVKKTNLVLEHYRYSMGIMRDYFYQNSSESTRRVVNTIDIYANPTPALRSRMLKQTLGTERAIAIPIIFAIAGQLFGTYRLWHTSPRNVSAIAVSLALSLTSAGGAAVIIYNLWRLRLWAFRCPGRKK